MEEGYHHHHHHHNHNGHEQSDSDSQQAQTFTQRSEQDQQSVNQTTTAPVEVPRPSEKRLGGVQTTSSFHSVSSIDSSAEMAKYFPDAPTPTLTAYSRDNQDNESGETQSAVSNNGGPYATVPVPAPATVQKPQQLSQPAQAPVAVPQQQPQKQQPIQPSGVPSYLTQIEGLSVSQTVVNDVIVDLQSKVINETQQQYYDEASSGQYFEPISPIYIRAPNPSIILRSDLHRLRAQLTARPPVVVRNPGGFQVPNFPPPQ